MINPHASVEDRIKQILVEFEGVHPDKITNDAKFVENLGFDSLDLVELSIELEDKFSCEVPEEDFLKFITVGDTVAYLKEHGR